MPGRDITKKGSNMSLRGTATPEPPSPSLSAVHASGVSIPVPKLKLSGTTAASSASSLLLKKNGTESATTDGKGHSKPQAGPSNDEDEDLTQSRWFIRTWPLRSTPAPKVIPEKIKRESRPPTPPGPATITPGQASHNSDEIVGTSEVSTTAGTNVIDPPAKFSDAPTSTNQHPAPTDDVKNTHTDESDQEIAPITAPDTQQGWVGWLWYGSQQAAALITAAATNPTTTPTTKTTDEVTVPQKEPEISTTDIPAQPSAPTLSVSIPSTVSATENTNRAPSVHVFDPQPESTSPIPPPARSSWFGLWGGYPVVQPTTAIVDKTGSAEEELQGVVTDPATSSEIVAPVEEQAPIVSSPPSISEPAPQDISDSNAPASVTPVATSSGWGFWYRAGGNATATSHASSSTEPPKDTIVNTSAQTLPQKDEELIATVIASSSQSQASQRTKGGVPTIVPVVAPKEDKATKDRNGTATPVQFNVPPPTPTPTPAVNKLQRICPPNHVFPDFDACYNLVETPPFYCKLTRLFKKRAQIPKNHLFRAHTPRQVKKAVAIGVHGFFPMRLVRTVLGEPTGTSVRFAQSAAAAIKRWAEHNGVEIEVETVALEGEGKVADRVDMLWKLLEKWVDHVKNADYVMIGAHSQGVVVGLQLLARMIEQGWVDDARVGVAAMAGINLGPFYHLPTSILTGSAKELFEFQRPESAVSKKYIQALRVVLAHDVRIVFIGSIDDQLVPLESSTFANIHHPYIYRAVFVDGRVHEPNFLSNLVGFAMKLRNLGISDHGLIRQLSLPLAGSLYGGEGHSRIYDDDRVYDLAIRHALETTDCPDVPLRVDPFELPTTNNNPFFLPWAMRGLLEESFVRTKLEQEKDELLQQFEDWKPTSKVLKDVKFRLEGINHTRSKL